MFQDIDPIEVPPVVILIIGILIAVAVFVVGAGTALCLFGR
jgi:hypothetical protein